MSKVHCVYACESEDDVMLSPIVDQVDRPSLFYNFAEAAQHPPSAFT